MNEDFVTYELAVKLKEKGFDELCTYAYCEQGGWKKYRQVHEPITYILRTDGNPFGSFYCGKNWNIKYETNKNKICCSAPTISQVLKWLRNEKKVFVLIDIRTDLTFFYEIWGIEIALHPLGCVPFQKYQSYEQATLAGIEYVLDNLI